MNRGTRLAGAFAAGMLLAAASAGAVTYQTTIADANRVGLTVTNYGVLGNSFQTRAPSLEYPLGTGYEHLVHGGLWVGAHATDALGGFTGVTTSMIDFGVGSPNVGITEFTPSGDVILRRSRLGGSPYYSPTAVSLLDLIGRFDDITPKTTYFSEVHRPLNVAVRQVSHQWNQPGWEDFAIQRFVIRNAGGFPLTGVHVGLYVELASGPKNAYGTWPPTANSSIYGSWYRKALLAYDDPQRLLREHRCSGPPVPLACHFEITPAWMGVQVLTPPTAGQQVTVAVWEWTPGDTLRDTDAERYAILSAGTIADVMAPEFLPGTGDPINVIALGPFASIAPGDSIEVAFALVGGGDEAAIQANAAIAQQVRDNGYSSFVAVEDGGVGGALRLAPSSNPLARGAACSIGFTLPAAGTARLDVVDASGRRVATRDLGGFGAGRHIVRLDELAAAVPGIYFLRLTSGAEVAKSRIVVLP